MVKEECKSIRECKIIDEDGTGCGHIQPDYRKIGLSIIRDYGRNQGPTN